MSVPPPHPLADLDAEPQLFGSIHIMATGIDVPGGPGDDILTGASDDDTMEGFAGDDSLFGLGGADTIDGGGDDDTLIGGAGADHLIGGDGSDWASYEDAGEGVTASLADASGNTNDAAGDSYDGVENLLGSDFSDDLTGDIGDNFLSGGGAFDLLHGGDGDDTLDGGGGGDSMTGGDGDDVYYVDNGGDGIIEGSTATSGTDLVYSTVSYTLASNVENLVLVIGSGAYSGFGNGLANSITGNEGGNSLFGGAGDDTLDGGQGADDMSGQGDNDTYIVDNLSDTIHESASGGTDTVRASVTFTLAGEVENLVLVAGAGALNGFGNGSANAITGNESANSIGGGAGDDTIDGGLGADTMEGGADNDTYYVDSLSDVVSEGSAAGADTVRSTVSFTLGADVEDLVLVAGACDLSGTGNDDTNHITGNEGDNSISGGGSFDLLLGGGGADTLDGGTGGDSMTGGDGDDVYHVDDGGDAVIENSGAGSGTDLVISSISYVLGGEVENLVLAAGTGAQSGSGNGAANAISGNENANSLLGGAGDDTLDGGLGADSLYGGADDDTYVVDSSSDLLFESSDEGTDTVRASVTFTLATDFENLVLASGAGAIDAFGNGAANQITGNEGANSIDGGAGADTMTGRAGDDTYVVDDAGDRVVERTDQGHDTVQTSLSFALASSVEDLELTGSTGLKGSGNKLDNAITGTTGDDTLYGGSGHDTLTGGQGDDAYTVRDSFAVIVEQAGEGNDLVRTTVDYILSDELDRLSLIGGAGIEATGNGGRNNILSSVGGDTIDAAGGDDWVTGRGGDDQISGGAGQDRLSGGDGADTFVFLAGDSTEAAPDRILDFEAGSDHIDLSGLDDHAGALHFSTARHLRGEAGQVIAVVGANATFVHVDLDGDGASDLTMTLKGAPTLTAADFVF